MAIEPVKTIEDYGRVLQPLLSRGNPHTRGLEGYNPRRMSGNTCNTCGAAGQLGVGAQTPLQD